MSNISDPVPEMTRFHDRLKEEILATPGVTLGNVEDGRASFGGVVVPQSDPQPTEASATEKKAPQEETRVATAPNSKNNDPFRVCCVSLGRLKKNCPKKI